MPVIQPVQSDSANPDQKRILEGIRSKMGKVPNIYATIAQSPTTLESMMAYNAGLKKGRLTPQEIEVIALAVGQENKCEYCLAAHTVMGKMAGLSADEMMEARKGAMADPRKNALVKFSVDLVRSKGFPSQASVQDFLRAGYDQAALVDATAWVAFNIFTNYINHVAETEIDFPKAPPLK